MMPNAKVKLLIVDDEPSIRVSLSQIFIASGHSVRSAVDGFSALIAIRQEAPDILLSDLNVPGMSGFELLSVVRRRFPAIQVIAMSGSFSGDGVPPGVAADAFYEKGTGVGSLLQMVEIMAQSERPPSFQHLSMLAPIWIPRNGHDPSGEAYVIITCPECLRTFPQVFGEGLHPIYETGCVYCHSLIHYAIVQRTDPATPQTFRRKPGTGAPTSQGVPDFR
ncbi:MAG: response regulator [Alloacidobacterium sp.]